MMPPPVRIALVGLGSVAEAYLQHVRRLEQQGTARLTWICGRSESKRVSAIAAFGCRNYTTDYAGLLDRPDVDAVILLTPMPLHGRQAAMALKAGKHVLVEKPLATTMREADALVRLARRSKTILVPAPFVTLHATFRRILQLVRKGAIGGVHSALGLYGWAGPDWTGWFYQAGGGPVFDLGVYNLMALTALLGSVKRVTAAGGIAIPRRKIAGRWMKPKVEDLLHITLDFGNVKFATIVCGFTIQKSNRPGLELYGTTGTINLLGETWEPRGFEMWRNAEESWRRFPETEPNWPWTAGLDHLVECIQQTKKPVVTVEHARHLVEVMLAAHRAARTRRAVPIRSTFPPLKLPAPPDLAWHLVHDPSRHG